MARTNDFDAAEYLRTGDVKKTIPGKATEAMNQLGQLRVQIRKTKVTANLLIQEYGDSAPKFLMRGLEHLDYLTAILRSELNEWSQNLKAKALASWTVGRTFADVQEHEQTVLDHVIDQLRGCDLLGEYHDRVREQENIINAATDIELSGAVQWKDNISGAQSTVDLYGFVEGDNQTGKATFRWTPHRGESDACSSNEAQASDDLIDE